MDFDPRDRDRDDDIRDVEMPCVDLRALEREQDDLRDRDEYVRERDSPERAIDPRDPFVEGLELPRGPEREVVVDGDHR